MLLACPCIVSACTAPIEVSLAQIYQEYSWGFDDELRNRQTIVDILEQFSLELLPGVGTGDRNVPRVLRSRSMNALAQFALRLIETGESEVCEFKSSLAFDRQKFANNPALPKSDCHSSKVTFSTLKVIASFLNTNGGTLFLGVDDSGACIGVEDDFACLTSIKGDFDGLDLYLRGKIKKHFVDGDVINAYVKTRRMIVNDKLILECTVAARGNLSFLTNEGPAQLYIRRGTSSADIPYEKLESYFQLSRKF